MLLFLQDFIKIVRLFLAAVSVKGLMNLCLLCPKYLITLLIAYSAMPLLKNIYFKYFNSFTPAQISLKCMLKSKVIYKSITDLHNPGLGNIGPALTAVWSKALPLTASCLSLLSGFESHPGHVRQLPVTWG